MMILASAGQPLDINRLSLSRKRVILSIDQTIHSKNKRSKFHHVKQQNITNSNNNTKKVKKEEEDDIQINEEDNFDDDNKEEDDGSDIEGNDEEDNNDNNNDNDDKNSNTDDHDYEEDDNNVIISRLPPNTRFLSNFLNSTLSHNHRLQHVYNSIITSNQSDTITNEYLLDEKQLSVKNRQRKGRGKFRFDNNNHDEDVNHNNLLNVREDFNSKFSSLSPPQQEEYLKLHNKYKRARGVALLHSIAKQYGINISIHTTSKTMKTTKTSQHQHQYQLNPTEQIQILSQNDQKKNLLTIRKDLSTESDSSTRTVYANNSESELINRSLNSSSLNKLLSSNSPNTRTVIIDSSTLPDFIVDYHDDNDDEMLLPNNQEIKIDTAHNERFGDKLTHKKLKNLIHPVISFDQIYNNNTTPMPISTNATNPTFRRKLIRPKLSSSIQLTEGIQIPPSIPTSASTPQQQTESYTNINKILTTPPIGTISTSVQKRKIIKLLDGKDQINPVIGNLSSEVVRESLNDKKSIQTTTKPISQKGKVVSLLSSLNPSENGNCKSNNYDYDKSHGTSIDTGKSLVPSTPVARKGLFLSALRSAGIRK